MRWIQRNRQNRRTKLPRITISEEEILADLQYPARPSRRPSDEPRRGAAR